jgi:hypothetical protein
VQTLNEARRPYLRVPRTFRKIKNKSTITTGTDANSSRKTSLTPPATALIPAVSALVIELITARNNPTPMMTKVETNAAIKHMDVCFDMLIVPHFFNFAAMVSDVLPQGQ